MFLRVLAWRMSTGASNDSPVHFLVMNRASALFYVSNDVSGMVVDTQCRSVTTRAGFSSGTCGEENGSMYIFM